jgi:PAS domain-containing protein
LTHITAGEGETLSGSQIMLAGRFDASAVLEHMTDGFLAFDSAWNCIFVNTAAETNLGLSRAALLGRNHRSGGKPATVVLRTVLTWRDGFHRSA